MSHVSVDRDQEIKELECAVDTITNTVGYATAKAQQTLNRHRTTFRLPEDIMSMIFVHVHQDTWIKDKGVGRFSLMHVYVAIEEHLG